MPRILGVVDFIRQKECIVDAAKAVSGSIWRCMTLKEASHRGADLSADIALIEITSDLRQIPLIRQIRQTSPDCRIICLANGAALFGVNKVAQAGAHAYLRMYGSPERRTFAILAELVRDKLFETPRQPVSVVAA